jgi:hypothetical protein
LSRLRGLGDELFMRQFGNPQLYTQSEAMWAIYELISAAILLVMTMISFLLVSGLRRHLAWSRWLALGQAGLLVLVAGVYSIPLMVDKRWKVSDACAPMLPGLFLALFTVLLWQPRMAAFFRPRFKGLNGGAAS